MRKDWSDLEEKLLIQNYSTNSIKFCCDLLGRTEASVKNKVKRLGINKRKFWTEDDDNLLIQYYSAKGNKFCCDLLGRSKDSIKNRVKKLNINRPKSSTKLKTDSEYKADLLEYTNDYTAIESYINNNTSILHKHTICGFEWKVKPRVILSGHGCPKCSNTGFNPDVAATLYFVNFPKIDLFKIGITNNLKNRLNSFGHNCNILISKQFDVGTLAKDLESKILELYKSSLYNSNHLNSGNTETFMFNNNEVDDIIKLIQA